MKGWEYDRGPLSSVFLRLVQSLRALLSHETYTDPTRFAVDPTAMSPGQTFGKQHTGTYRVPMVAALLAYQRSAALNTNIDAMPLFESWSKLADELQSG